MGMGVHAAVLVEELNQEYLNTPFHNPICQIKEELGNQWSNLTTANYTQNQCIGVCFNAIALQLCNCTYPQDKRLFDRLDKTRICTPHEAVHCLQAAVESNPLVHQCAQNCLPECHQTQYRTSVSTADLESISWHGQSQSQVDNRLIVDIFFSKIQRTNVREIYIVTPDGLISQVGGLLGIFLGASMITAVQLIMYWISLCLHCLKTLNRKRRKRMRGFRRGNAVKSRAVNGLYAHSSLDSPVRVGRIETLDTLYT